MKKNITAFLVVAIMIGFTFLFTSCTQGDSAHIPVYTGMSLLDSDEQQETLMRAAPMPVLCLTSTDTYEQRAPLILLSNTLSNKSKDNHPNKKPFESLIEDSIITPSAETKLCYAKPGETIRINVHFDNPHKYEILSFTLNGEKYGIQMFLEGSDMENLIVEYTIPDDAEGIMECTIDAIKYIDGENIKDVKIGGDRTIKIGVYVKNQPTAKIENDEITDEMISLDVTVSDPKGLITDYKNELQIVLADEEGLIESKEFSVGEKISVSFEGLTPNNYYRYAVIAVYDAYDGKGVATHILYEATVNEYKITYELDGGENPQDNPELYISADGAVVKDPIKNGCVFLGWTHDSQDTPQKGLVIPVGSHGDITLTAHWRENQFRVFNEIVDEGQIILEYASDYQILYPSGEQRVHLGVDLSAKIGAEVYAACNGTVTKIWDTPDMGYSIAIEHVDGYMTVYRSLSTTLPEGIAEGTEVEAGQVIAYVGKPSGVEAGMRSHVHFEILQNDTVLNPVTFLPQ